MSDIKTWKQRLEETAARTKEGNLHTSVEEIEENMQAEIDELRAKLKALEEQEPVAWMFPDDIELFKKTEATATSFSVKVGSPHAGTSLPLYTAAGAKS